MSVSSLPDAPRHIALFTRTMHGGGLERVVGNLANEFARRGHQVDLVLAEAVGDFLGALDSRVRVVPLNAPKLRAYTLALARYLRKQKPEALLSASDECNLAAVWARGIAQVSTHLVVSCHSTLSRYVPVARDRKVRLLPFLIRRTYSYADAVVAVSEGVADDLAKVSGISREKIKVIYNPAVMDAMIDGDRPPVDHPWFVQRTEPVILGVGNLRRAKDFPTLIRAFKRLLGVKSARLVILGEGVDRAALEALVASEGLVDRVQLPGFCQNPWDYIAAADLFVLSSEWEGLPTVLIEALALGTRVVATDCPSGPREILEGGRHGELVPVGDSALLAQAMIRALENPGDAVTRRQSARRFTPGPSGDAYLSLLLGHSDQA